MKKVLIIVLVIGVFGCSTVKKTSQADDNSPIKVGLDLTALSEDRVPVEFDPGRIVKDTVVFRLPRVVQGTYAVSNFGQFIDDFKAFGYDGTELSVIKKDTNSWVIPNAVALDKITYFVNDTYDIEGGEIATPFSPSGTNIQPEAFVLNLHGFVGYFDHKPFSYEISVTAPADMKNTSALPKVRSVASEDGSEETITYLANRYFDVTDNPMFYGDLDIQEFQVGDIKIVLSVYSPNGVHKAEQIKNTLFKMMEAQKAYLGDVNSTKRYDVILYLSAMGPGTPQGFGALEHHTSTVVVLPEPSPAPQLDESMIDVVSHEFFHIITPLTVHSEDVHYFDYDRPTFSKHLWMYEGITEYFASHFQITEDLVSEEEFYSKMVGKIQTASGLDDEMSFTEMSENILEEPYASNYYNVYMKGALIGMCLDILLREESNGQRSMLTLMKELSKKYGQDKPFNDDTIINEIVDLTYPSVGEFFETHVKGNTPIDYNDFLRKVGLELKDAKVQTNYVLNGQSLILKADRENNGIRFNELVLDNSFWADNGVQPDDLVKTWNDVELSLANANTVIQQSLQWQPGQNVKVVLDRNGEEIIIEGELTETFTTGMSMIPMESASDEQLALRKAWLQQ